MSGKSIRARAPSASSPLARRVMIANWGGNTAPEREFRRALHQAGLRYRKDQKPEQALRCTADIVFPKQKTCIFIDGCFWHGCRFHFECPKVHGSWWKEKIQANRARDKRQTLYLRKSGWTVIRVWEHAINPKSLPRLVTLVEEALGGCARGRSRRKFGTSRTRN